MGAPGSGKGSQSKLLADLGYIQISTGDLLREEIASESELGKEIAELALRHVQYGTKPEHYEIVGDALLWTIEKALGKDWNDDVKTAWTLCYSTLSNSMIEATKVKNK